ncbi:unnamed protein product [Discula destructiva]
MSASNNQGDDWPNSPSIRQAPSISGTAGGEQGGGGGGGIPSPRLDANLVDHLRDLSAAQLRQIILVICAGDTYLNHQALVQIQAMQACKESAREDKLRGISMNAKIMFNWLSNVTTDGEALPVDVISLGTGLPAEEVMKTSEELLASKLISAGEGSSFAVRDP